MNRFQQRAGESNVGFTLRICEKMFSQLTALETEQVADWWGRAQSIMPAADLEVERIRGEHNTYVRETEKRIADMRERSNFEIRTAEDDRDDWRDVARCMGRTVDFMIALSERQEDDR